MASEIKNISLAITSETGLQDALQGVITQSFTLTDYDDGSDTPVLTAGRTGEIGSALYRVEDGVFTVDVSDVSANGTYYIYVEDEGMAVTAYADDTAPTWSEEKGGFYNGNAKAFFLFVWDGTDYNARADILQVKGYVPENITVTNITVSGTINEGSSAGSLPPIGSIIGLHPDVKTTLGLNSNIWSPCDGVADLPSDYFNHTNDTKVPDLTDSRFLMGSSSYERAGSNTTNIEHNHRWVFINYVGAPKTLQEYYSYDNVGDTKTFGRLDVSLNTNSRNYLITETSTTGKMSGIGDGHWTSLGGSTEQSITPSYFKVKYYIRIR